MNRDPNLQAPAARASDTDDIADPPVPTEVLVGLLPGETLADVKGELRELLRFMAQSYNALTPRAEQYAQSLCEVVGARLDKLSPQDGQALRHLCESLDRMTGQGLTVVSSGVPYSATLHASTPRGFPCTLTIQRQDGAQFLEALGKMGAWLVQQGYTVPEHVLT